MTAPDDVALADRMKDGRERIIKELRKLIVGQEDIINQVMLTLFVGGNSLIVGVPGLAKTLLIHTMAKVVDLKFSRIQFTPDLMPSDITGTDIIQEDAATGRRSMVFSPGPIFCNILLADEINRTPPKTQSALLEAMQEHRVTIQGRTYKLEEPVNGADLVAFQRLVRRVPVADPVMRYALALVRASRPKNPNCPESIRKWIAFGASVRGAQNLVLAGKARALTSGRYHVSFEDIRAVAHSVLRHRVLTNFHAQSEGVTSDSLIDKLIESVPSPKSGM